MSMTLEQVEALLPDFQYVDGDDTVVTVEFAASFYFWGGHTAAKRQALADCFEAFVAAYGQELRWFFDEEDHEELDLTRKALPSIRQYIQRMDEDDTVAWFCTSGTESTAGDYEISCFTERGWMNGEISGLRFHVPRSVVFDAASQKALSDLVHLCLERLAPFQANAGFAAVSTYEEYKWEPEELDLATRYLALYTDSRVYDPMQAAHGIKGVNWLTFVSDVLCERVGGPQAFEQYCQRFGITPQRWGQGYIVLAGDLPELGPVTEPPPEAYVKANAALRPLRNGSFGSMGMGSMDGELHFDRCTSDLWIRRFDAPGIWPPASLIGLGKKPLGGKPAKRVKLKTGETCAVHGRYRDPADDADDENVFCVVLLPGDVAPYRLQLGPHGEYQGRKAIAWELVAELSPPSDSP